MIPPGQQSTSREKQNEQWLRLAHIHYADTEDQHRFHSTHHRGGNLSQVGGQTVLRFAYAYGFRNIQSILAKARRGKCPYQFVEVMACPSGCVNGGGQIKPKKEGPRETGQRVERVSEVLRNRRVPRRPEDNPFVQAVYRELLACDPGGNAARGLLHTAYHNVPKLELSNPHMAPW